MATLVAAALYYCIERFSINHLSVIGTFLSYLIGISVTVASIVITIKISRAATRISRRLGDSDILNFVDTRLSSALKSIHGLALSIDSVHNTPKNLELVVEAIGDKLTDFNEETPDTLEKLYQDYNKFLDFVANKLFECAEENLKKYRDLLRQMYDDISKALVSMMENPLTLALLHVSLDPNLKGPQPDSGSHYSKQVADVLGKMSGKDAADKVVKLKSVPDIIEALRQRLDVQKVFSNDKSDLKILARNLIEVLMFLAAAEDSDDIAPLAILGALISLEVVTTNENAPDSKNAKSVWCNQGLVILATILESLPSRHAFEKFFRKVYDDPYSEKLAANYIETCGIDREMYWATTHRQDWNSIKQNPRWALGEIPCTQETLIQYLRKKFDDDMPEDGAAQKLSGERSWRWRLWLPRPSEYIQACRPIDVARIAARIQRGAPLSEACKIYDVTEEDYSRRRNRSAFPIWFGPLGDIAEEQKWYNMLARAAIASRVSRGTQ